MVKKTAVLVFLLVIFILSLAPAQEKDPYYELDPKPYNPAVDVNMDMFMSHWKESHPRYAYGSLVIRDIFTKNTSDDPLKPHARGAVLNVLKEYAYGTLASRTSTTPSTLKGEQKIFYFIDGEGTITAGGKKAGVYAYVAVLIPEELVFTITNTGTEPLNMILIGEYVPVGFKPRKDMLVRDENALPITGTTGHWVNINKRLFNRDDGLATIIGMSPVWLDPLTMAQPHASRGLGTDVLWIALEGDIYTLLGKKLRRLTPGTAFKNPSDGKVYHANINVTDKPIKLLWTRTIAPEDMK